MGREKEEEIGTTYNIANEHKNEKDGLLEGGEGAEIDGGQAGNSESGVAQKKAVNECCTESRSARR